MNSITPVHRSEWIEIERPFPGLCAVDSRSRRRAGELRHPPPCRRQRPQGHPDAGRTGRRRALSTGRDLPAGQRDPAASPIRKPKSLPARPHSRRSRCTARRRTAREQIRAADDRFLRYFERYTAPVVSASCAPIDDPRLQLSGWFCQGGSEFIAQSTLACALDRLTLLAAGSEPKIGALFAQAELNRSYCGQRDPILAATPKYHLLWKALANRPEPRRIGR